MLFINTLNNQIAKDLNSDDYVRYTQIPEFIATKDYINNCKEQIKNSLVKLEE